jgi:excisionase family DNA binding protein
MPPGVGFNPTPLLFDEGERDLTMMNLVTEKEVGEFLGLTEKTIYKLASEGDLPGFKMGKSWRFDMDEIFRAISAHKGFKDKVDTNDQKGK